LWELSEILEKQEEEEKNWNIVNL